MDSQSEETTVVLERFTSRALADNPLGDPATRVLPVLLPPGYDAQPSRRYPVLYALTGYTGRGTMMLNDKAWGLNIRQRLDRLYAGGMPHVILVLPDCFTCYGGSQYINSAGTGRYEDYLVEELVPFVDSRYRTIPSRDRRGVFGKSSGGYGALVLGMRRAAIFGAVACHSGDMAFDLCYTPDFPKAGNAINAVGGLEAWWRAFQAKPKKSGSDISTLMVIAMAACYSPDSAEPLGVALPFDLHTCAAREEVWSRWRAWDPIVMVDGCADALRSLRALFIDCGSRDEYHLHYGSRQLVQRLRALGIAHEYEEFDDGHMDIDYRYDASLPRLLQALTS